MAVGILALQGAFLEHERMLDELGAAHFEIRKRQDLEGRLDALIFPGGESTVKGKLQRDLGLYAPLRERIRGGMPVLGTCAGLILLAEEVEGGSPCLATMAVTARRNAYGRQLGSFHTDWEFAGLGTIPMTFIRAPYIAGISGGAETPWEGSGEEGTERHGKCAAETAACVRPAERVEILARVAGNIVAARQEQQLVCV